MDIKDICLGNWFINEDYDPYQVTVFELMKFETGDDEDFTPIKINSKILKAFGFEEFFAGIWVYEKDPLLKSKLRIWVKSDPWKVNDKYFIAEFPRPIQYVHHLQNVCRFLYDQEIEITLIDLLRPEY